MACDPPQMCKHTTFHERMPPRRAGEVAVQAFRAPQENYPEPQASMQPTDNELEGGAAKAGPSGGGGPTQVVQIGGVLHVPTGATVQTVDTNVSPVGVWSGVILPPKVPTAVAQAEAVPPTSAQPAPVLAPPQQVEEQQGPAEPGPLGDTQVASPQQEVMPPPGVAAEQPDELPISPDTPMLKVPTAEEMAGGGNQIVIEQPLGQ